MEVAEAALVQGLGVLACTGEPPRDGGWSKAENPRSSGRIQPFGQCREHHGDLLGGGFQAIQGRVPSSAERGAARLTAKRLNALVLAMLAIPDQRVDLSIGDPTIHALLIGAGVAL